MQHNTQCDKILNAKKFRMPHTVQYRNPECDTRPNVDLPNICGPLPNTWGTLPNKYGPLPNIHESHYLTQSGQDIQMTQTNLLIIRITLLMTWLGWRVGTPPPPLGTPSVCWRSLAGTFGMPTTTSHTVAPSSRPMGWSSSFRSVYQSIYQHWHTGPGSSSSFRYTSHHLPT